MRCLSTLLVVLASVAAVYSVGLDNGFVWLDHFEIVEGALIVDSPADALRLFGDDRNFVGYHRPIYNLLLSLDRALFGLQPLGFQVSTRLLHLGNVALVLWLARRLGWSLLWAGLLALLFGLHPLNTACAGLIHAKADLFVLSAMAGSLALFLGRGPHPAAGLGRALSLGCFALALLTKESAFSLPIGASLWLAAERRAGRSTRAATSWVLGTWALALAAGLLRLAATDTRYASPLALPERMLTFALVYADDLRRLVLPLDLAEADTVTRFGALPRAAQIQGLASFALACAAQAWLAWRAPWSRKWIVLGNLALLPVAQIVPILHFRADRFLYVPSLAFLGAALEALQRALGAAPARARVRWSVALLGLVAGLYALRDVSRLRQFESDETFFVAELRRRGDYLEGLSHLARHLDRTGRAPQATALYAACFEPRPDIVSYFDGERTLLASSANLLAVGRPAEALALLERFPHATYSRVVREELAYNRAVALKQLGRGAEALPLLEHYARTHPADAGCAYLLGEVALAEGQHARARAAFERYLSLVPDAPERAALERVLSAPAPE